MLTGVEYVRNICTQRGIAVSTLERDLGFSNGYLNPKKLKKIPYERAISIAEYLKVAIEPILGIETENAPTDNGERKHDDFKAAFFDGYGDDLTEAEKDDLWEDARQYARFKASQMKTRKD